MNEYLNENYIDIPFSEQNRGKVENTIINLLSKNNFSLSQTRGIFMSIIERFERYMPVTCDLSEDKLRIKECGKCLEIGAYTRHLNINGSHKKISLVFYDENGKKYVPSSINTEITMYDENGNTVPFDGLLHVSVNPSYLEFYADNPLAKNMTVKISIKDLSNDSVSGKIQFTIDDII